MRAMSMVVRPVTKEYRGLEQIRIMVSVSLDDAGDEEQHRLPKKQKAELIAAKKWIEHAMAVARRDGVKTR